jgi:hypothetical protein
MADSIELNVQAQISPQTFFDLGMWLTVEQDYSHEQLVRLQDEDLCLPLISLANNYWLIGPLANQLKKNKVWSLLPVQLRAYLVELEVLYYQRAENIQQEVIFACKLLNQASLDVALLKGAANLFNGVADPISNRYMSDIDLLVHEDCMSQSEELLKSVGYHNDDDEFLIEDHQHHHAPALIRDGGACYVEVHRWVLMKSLNKLLNEQEVWRDAVPLILNDDLQVKQLHPTQQIIQSIAHSEISDRGYDDKHIDLRQLLNLHAIAKHFETQINWQTVKQHFERSEKLDVLYVTLFKAYKLFKLDTPLTDKHNVLAKQHFEECLHLYIKQQNYTPTFGYLRAVLKGYSKTTILDLYGYHGTFPVFKGRVKHLKRHIQMLFMPKYIKRFIDRNLNRED